MEAEDNVLISAEDKMDSFQDVPFEKPVVIATYGLNMCTGHDWGDC